jgi:integrase
LRVNRQVEKHINAIKDIFDEYKVTSTSFDRSRFKNLVYKVVNPSKCKNEAISYSAISIFDDYVKKYGSSVGHKRVQRYQFVQKMVGDFLELNYRNRHQSIDVLEREFYIKFKNYLQRQRCLHISTLEGYMKVLKAAAREAVASRKLPFFPFDGVKNETVNAVRYFLTQKEVELLRGLNNLPTSLQKAQDLFMFQVYTGMAYSDMKRLSAGQIVSLNGQRIITGNRTKTMISFAVPLVLQAQNIVKRWGNLENANAPLIPVPCLEDYNRALKMLQLKAGIHKKITSHIGRHTFACAYLEAGGSFEVLSKMLGHSNIRTTQIYGKIMPSRVIGESNKVFKNFLKGLSISDN